MGRPKSTKRRCIAAADGECELPLAMLPHTAELRLELGGSHVQLCEDAINEEMICTRRRFKSVYAVRSMSKFATETCDERLPSKA